MRSVTEIYNEIRRELRAPNSLPTEKSPSPPTPEEITHLLSLVQERENTLFFPLTARGPLRFPRLLIKKAMRRLLLHYLFRQTEMNTLMVKLLDHLSRQTLSLSAQMEELRKVAETFQARFDEISSQLQRWHRTLSVSEIFSSMPNDYYLIAVKSRECPTDFPVKDRTPPLSLEVDFRPEEIVRRSQKKFVSFFNAQDTIIDLGCGPGIFLELCREAGVKAFGIDASPSAITQCRQKGCEAVYGDVLHLLGNESTPPFTGVFCSHLIEHLTPAEVLSLLCHVNRRLPSGGKLVIITPHPESLFTQLVHFWRDPSHVRFYPPLLLRELVQATGFAVREISPDPDTAEAFPGKDP